VRTIIFITTRRSSRFLSTQNPGMRVFVHWICISHLSIQGILWFKSWIKLIRLFQSIERNLNTDINSFFSSCSLSPLHFIIALTCVFYMVGQLLIWCLFCSISGGFGFYFVSEFQTGFALINCTTDCRLSPVCLPVIACCEYSCSV